MIHILKTDETVMTCPKCGKVDTQRNLKYFHDEQCPVILKKLKRQVSKKSEVVEDLPASEPTAECVPPPPKLTRSDTLKIMR